MQKFKVGQEFRLATENDLMGFGYITVRVEKIKMMFGEQWVKFRFGTKFVKSSDVPIHPSSPKQD